MSKKVLIIATIEGFLKFENHFDKLIVCGGDGTLNQVTQGLCELERKVPVGYMATRNYE